MKELIEELIPGEVLLICTDDLKALGELTKKYKVKSIASIGEELREGETESRRYNLLCCVEPKQSFVGDIRKYPDSGKISRGELYEIVACVIGASLDDVTDEKHIWSDLGADSIDLIELIMALEEELGIEVSDRTADQIRTVGDVVELLKSQDLFMEEHPQAAATQ